MAVIGRDLDILSSKPNIERRETNSRQIGYGELTFRVFAAG